VSPENQNDAIAALERLIEMVTTVSREPESDTESWAVVSVVAVEPATLTGYQHQTQRRFAADDI
jgi:hypothetical protein